MYEAVDQEVGRNESKYNYGEIDLVIQMIKELIEAGLPEREIGVITPYSAQVSEIRKQLKKMEIGQVPSKKIEVSTVDGFQGREKEVIIISMVRSNAHSQIGFLSNEKRMNVAVTRAKRLCCLIGDSGTVSSNTFLSSLCSYFREHGQVRTAFDYAGNDEVRAGYGVRIADKQPASTQLDRAIAAKMSTTTEETKKLSIAERKRVKKDQDRQV